MVKVGEHTAGERYACIAPSVFGYSRIHTDVNIATIELILALQGTCFVRQFICENPKGSHVGARGKVPNFYDISRLVDALNIFGDLTGCIGTLICDR